tara:strand:- start:8645 stop:9385 length:741 start_codon:yes stop_codon:yes gene_type:complete
MNDNENKENRDATLEALESHKNSENVFSETDLYPNHIGLESEYNNLFAELSAKRLFFSPKQLSETLEIIALALVIFLGVRGLAQNFIVSGESMSPTFQANQLLIANRLAYIDINTTWIPWEKDNRWQPFGNPKQGDIVIFRFPGDTERDFLKRILAVPGQTIEIRNGTVFVDNQALIEPYVVDPWFTTMVPQTVPPDNFFVVGDNRKNSFDSRSWGMLKKELLIGRADFRYWPIKKMGFIEHYEYQ